MQVEDAERPGPLLETIEAGSEEKPQGTREDCAVVAQVSRTVLSQEKRATFLFYQVPDRASAYTSPVALIHVSKFCSSELSADILVAV